jgi:hypothetical protein
MRASSSPVPREPRSTPASRGIRRIAQVLGAFGIALAGLGLVPGVASAAGTKAPYSDPGQVGYVGLCNEAGKQITSGSIYSVPFAWRAVSSVKARAPYNDDWRTAMLLAYQPQNGLTAGEWSGEELTASSRYTNVNHPMAAATKGDQSLEDFLEAYPAVWDGWVELRIYLDTANAEVDSLTYPALDIKVTGDTWHAVGGGPVNCHSGTSESLETEVLGHPGTTTSSTSTASALGTTSSSSSALLPVAIAIAVVALLVGATVLTRRRRHATQPAKSNN